MGGSPKKIGAMDAAAIRLKMDEAILFVEPEEITQRKIFESLMPYVYILRNKGCSWNQITKLVVASGLNLQPSTIKGYYSKMLATRQDICQERMNEQRLVIAEIRKQSNMSGPSSVSAKVALAMQKRNSTELAALD